MPFHLEQKAARIRNDDGTETTALWRDDQNKPTVVWALDINMRVRFEVQEIGAVAGASTAQLQYSKNGGAFTNVTAASTNVRSSASPNLADGAATTNQLTAGTGTFVAGTFDEVDGAVASVSFGASGHTEWEFSVQVRSADVTDGDTLALRLTFGGDASPVYTFTPVIVAHAGPLMKLLVSFDGAQVSSPTWFDKTPKLLAFSIARGGENELEGLDVGTVTLTLDNRDRWADPFNTSSPHSPNVLPRRRVKLTSQDQGAEVDQFYGWTGGWPQGWDSSESFQVTTPQGRDAFGLLAKDNLSQTSPASDSYRGVVEFDDPQVYIPVDEPAGSTQISCAIGGRDSDGAGTKPTLGVTGLIAGEAATAGRVGAVDAQFSWVEANGSIANMAGLSAVSVEAWIRVDTVGTVRAWIFRARGGTTDPQFSLEVSAAEQVIFRVDAGTTTAITGGTTLTAGTIYHVAGTYDGANMRLYLNGVIDAGPTAKTGTIDSNAGVADEMVLDGFGAGGIVLSAGHIAIYTSTLSAARVLAHYEAGANQGFAQELVNTRIGNVLDGSGVSFLTRSLRTASRNVRVFYANGQNRREVIDEAVKAEGDPAMVFQAKNGTITFLDRAHRTVAPWNAAVATFDSDGTDVPYHGITPDDGESFIYNDVRVTPRGGTLQQSTDATSGTAYGPSTLDRGTTENVSDSDASAEAAALLAKYKDPLPRILSLRLEGGDLLTRAQMIARELGDCIRVIYRPKGGGSAIDQTLFIRKIVLEGGEDNPFWTATWSVAKR